MEPYEEEVVEERPVVRRRYIGGGDPFGTIIGLLLLILIILFVLELFGVTDFIGGIGPADTTTDQAPVVEVTEEIEPAATVAP